MDAAAFVPPIIERCSARGFDLAGVTTTGRYHSRVDSGYRLPDFGRSDALVLVIGNSRALWPHVIGVWDLPDFADDPVDTLTERVIGDALSAVDAPPHEVRFAHDPPERRVAIQQLAHCAGLAWLAPSHISVHETYGPWIALRAAIVFDVPGSKGADAVEPPCDCSEGCMPALARALTGGEPRTRAEMQREWRRWLAVRDSCPTGKEHRYTEEQILYHYTGRRTR